MDVCKKCDKLFYSKHDLKIHQKQKCEKDNFISLKDQKVKIYKCQLCNKPYKRECYFKKHLENCKKHLEKKAIQNLIQNQNITNINNIDNSVQNIINKNITNNTNNLVLNFQFNVDGKEKIDHITKENFLEICKNKFSVAVTELMRLIYFNKNVPRNNKWCVGFPKEEYGALQYNPKTEFIERWITSKIVDGNFENMVNVINPFVDDIYDDKKLYNGLNQTQKINLDLFCRYFGVSNLSTENPSEFKNIKMMAFNNKSVPIELWNSLKLRGGYHNIKI